MQSSTSLLTATKVYLAECDTTYSTEPDRFKQLDAALFRDT